MNYIELQQKILEKRYKRVLESSKPEIFMFQLRLFWGFLNNNSLFFSIIDEHLKKNKDFAKNNAGLFIDGNGTYLPNESQRFAVYCYLMEYSIKDLKKVRKIVSAHKTEPNNDEDLIRHFIEIFCNFFVDYLQEKIYERQTTLFSLIRFKRAAEWFNSESLLEILKQDKDIGEALLKKELFKFLHIEGIEFYIEPESASGKIDCIINQTGQEKLIIEAKIFNNTNGKNKKNILSGFNQVYTYANNYNENCSYLVIFKTCIEDIKFELNYTNDKIPYLYYNNKLFYFLVIDLYFDKTASKKGVLNIVEIKESELIKSVLEG